MSTLSLISSCCDSRLAICGAMPVSSRTRICTLRPATVSPCSAMYRSMPRRICLPYSANGPETEITRPIFRSLACAGPNASAAPSARVAAPRVLLRFISRSLVDEQSSAWTGLDGSLVNQLLLQPVQHLVALQHLRHARIRLAPFADRGEELAVLQLDAVHRHVDHSGLRTFWRGRSHFAGRRTFCRRRSERNLLS